MGFRHNSHGAYIATYRVTRVYLLDRGGEDVLIDTGWPGHDMRRLRARCVNPGPQQD
ncbi:MAG: hypothetical protein AAGH70_12915 [Pseudomonadota bacterium]